MKKEIFIRIKNGKEFETILKILNENNYSITRFSRSYYTPNGYINCILNNKRYDIIQKSEITEQEIFNYLETIGSLKRIYTLIELYKIKYIIMTGMEMKVNYLPKILNYE